MTGYSGDAREIRRHRRRRAVRLALARYRPLVGIGLVAATFGVVLVQLRPAPPAATLVVVAARDLPAGALIGSDDLTEARWPVGALPAGALTRTGALSGVRLAGPVRRGEPITDARVVGPGLLTGAPAGTVAVPVRIADATAAGLARAGDLVDLYAVAQQDVAEQDRAADPSVGDERALVGRRVRVLARLDASAGESGTLARFGAGSGDGATAGTADAGVPGTVLVVAASPSTAARLATASGTPIALVLRGEGSEAG